MVGICRALLDLPRHQIHADLDRHLPQHRMLQQMAHLSPAAFSRLRIPAPYMATVWNHSERRHNGPIRVCAACLESARYARKYWRTIFASVCPVHATALIDACPTCHHPIQYYAITGGILIQHWLENWPLCANCLSAITSNRAPANKTLVRISRFWVQALNGSAPRKFEPSGFLAMSRRILNAFKADPRYQETAELVRSRNPGDVAHLATALVVHAAINRRATPSVAQAALGLAFNPSQLAKDIMR